MNQNEVETLSCFIGSRLDYLQCDPFEYAPVVYGVVGLVFDGGGLEITNQFHVVNYFGDEEEVAVFGVCRANPQDFKSRVEDVVQVKVPVGQVVEDIKLVNITQCVNIDDIRYSRVFTKAICVECEINTFCFIQDEWFSELIEIQQDIDTASIGDNEFLQDWPADANPTQTTTVQSLSERLNN